MMKMAAIFLLVVGWVWVLFVVWLFLSIAGVADAPDSILRTLLYWGGMLVGPVGLIIGSTLLLRGASIRSGAVFVIIGCVILTGLSLYSSIPELRRTPQPLESPPMHWLYVVFLAVMLLSDVAAYKIFKGLGGVR